MYNRVQFMTSLQPCIRVAGCSLRVLERLWRLGKPAGRGSQVERRFAAVASRMHGSFRGHYRGPYRVTVGGRACGPFCGTAFASGLPPSVLLLLLRFFPSTAMVVACCVAEASRRRALFIAPRTAVVWEAEHCAVGLRENFALVCERQSGRN